MARKSDENLQDMTLRQLKAYSDTNPLEGHRISKQCRKIANHADKNFIMEHKARIFDSMFPTGKIPDKI